MEKSCQLCVCVCVWLLFGAFEEKREMNFCVEFGRNESMELRGKGHLPFL